MTQTLPQRTAALQAQLDAWQPGRYDVGDIHGNLAVEDLWTGDWLVEPDPERLLRIVRGIAEEVE